MPLPSSRRQCLQYIAVGVTGAGFAGCVGDSPAQSETTTEDSDITQVHAEYETTDVRIESAEGDRLGTVTAAIADTGELRYLGLSDTENLPENRGMLFMYDSSGNRTFVMREMDFGIDIIYADSEGVITSIHHADAPGPDEDGNNQQYPGQGQYVLEINKDWTTARDIEAGDVLVSEAIA